MRWLVALVVMVIGWNAARAEPRIVSQLRTGPLEPIVMTTDGRFVASGSRGGPMLSDAESGAIVWRNDGGAYPSAIAIVADGSRLVTIEGPVLRTYELATGGPLTRFDLPAKKWFKGLAVFPDGKRALLAHGKGLVLWQLEQGKVLREIAAPAGKTRCENVWISADGRALWSCVEALLVVDVARGGTVERELAVSSVLAVSADRQWALVRPKEPPTRAYLNKREVWNLRTGARVGAFALPSVYDRAAVSPDGRHVFTYASEPDDKLALVALDSGSGAVLARWGVEKSVASARSDIAISADGSRLVATRRTLSTWDVRKREAPRLVGASRLDVGSPWHVAWSPDGKRLLVGYSDGFVRLWDMTTGAVERVLARGGTELGDYVTAVAYAPDGRSVAWNRGTGDLVIADLVSGATSTSKAGGSVDQIVYVADGSQLLLLSSSTFQSVAAKGGAVRTHADRLSYSYHLTLSPDGKLAAFKSDAGVHVYDIASGSQVDSTTDKCAGLAFSSERELRCIGDGTVSTYTIGAKTGATSFATGIPKTIYSGLSSDRRYAAVSGAQHVAVFELATGKQTASFGVGARELAVSPNGSHIATLATDLRIWSVATGANIALHADGDEWIAIADDGVFDASRRGGALVASADRLVAYRVEQLAAHKNRPDLLLGRVGLGTPDLLDHYRARHARRLAKLGLVETAVAFDTAPRVAIASVAKEGGAARLELRLDAVGADLAALRIAVNEVPIYAGAGKAVAGRSATVSETVPLLPGANRIEVGAIDASGVESLRAYRDVDGEGDGRGALYFVGFGVSRYRDRALDLRFAHKDALDLGHLFAQAGAQFTAVHTKVFVDDQATVANLRAAKAFVAGARVEDTVVVFIAGHGTHSDDAAAEYYYVTHETDVARLRETAAPFELVEDLVSGIAARRKLLLLDTCESGERTADVAAPPPVDTGGRSVRARTTRALVRVAAAKVPAQRPYLFDRERFIYNDLARRTGAVVFSSSQGSELSYELDELRNGVFTHAIKQALTAEGTPWLDVDQLRATVVPVVAALTQQRQHPTVDRDNPWVTIRLARTPKLTFPDVPDSTSAAPAPIPAPVVAPRSPRGCGCAGADPSPAVAIALIALRRRRRRTVR